MGNFGGVFKSLNLLMSLLLIPIFNYILRKDFSRMIGEDFDSNRFKVQNVYNQLGNIEKLK